MFVILSELLLLVQIKSLQCCVCSLWVCDPHSLEARAHLVFYVFINGLKQLVINCRVHSFVGWQVRQEQLRSGPSHHHHLHHPPPLNISLSFFYYLPSQIRAPLRSFLTSPQTRSGQSQIRVRAAGTEPPPSSWLPSSGSVLVPSKPLERRWWSARGHGGREIIRHAAEQKLKKKKEGKVRSRSVPERRSPPTSLNFHQPPHNNMAAPACGTGAPQLEPQIRLARLVWGQPESNRDWWEIWWKQYWYWQNKEK